MDDTSSRIAENIRQALVDRRISQTEFAAAIQVSKATAERRLNAKRAFTVTEVVKAVSFLNSNRRAVDPEITIDLLVAS